MQHSAVAIFVRNRSLKASPRGQRYFPFVLNMCLPRIFLDPYKTVEFCKQDCSLKDNNQTCDVENGS